MKLSEPNGKRPEGQQTFRAFFSKETETKT